MLYAFYTPGIGLSWLVADSRKQAQATERAAEPLPWWWPRVPLPCAQRLAAWHGHRAPRTRPVPAV